MKTATDALKTYLATAEELYMADTYTFTLNNGTILRYTSLDRDITYNGYTYSKFNIERSGTKTVRGLEVDTLSLSIYPKDEVVGTASFIYSIIKGYFDSADFMLKRIFLTSWLGSVIDEIILFSGQVSSVNVDRTQVEMQIKSYIESLNVVLPRKIYIPGCQNTLYDSICGLNKDDYKDTGIVTLNSTLIMVKCDLTNADKYFDLGWILFTSGNNNGLSRTIKNYTEGIVNLIMPLEYVPEEDDTFDIYPGCTKTMSICESQYNNLSNFRGFPYIPDEEVVIYGGAGRAPSTITGGGK